MRATHRLARNKLFQPEPFIERMVVTRLRSTQMPAAEAKITMMPDGFLPESALMDPDTVNKYISDFGGE